MSDTTILQTVPMSLNRKNLWHFLAFRRAIRRLCTVGKSGNDLHYRGYDIIDLAEHCEFEEVAHLLIHGKLPTRDELAAYKTKLKALRGLPANVRTVLEALPRRRTRWMLCAPAFPRSAARCQKKRGIPSLARGILPTNCWRHLARFFSTGITTATTANASSRKTDDDSIGGHFLHLLHGEKPSQSWEKAMHISLVLYGRTRV
ncbi:hypothetical protein MWG48_00180 [Escherichia coli]|nr:hypothetical protein [Escherichia coli]